jgi:hypothetical protein
MTWKIWKRNKVGNLTQTMSQQLGTEYSISQETLNGLRYASRPGRFVEEDTTYFRVFDPGLLEASQVIRSYNALTNRLSAVLFQGRWKGGRILEISDLRPSS